MLKKFLVGTFIVAAFALVASSASADCSITTTLKVGSKGAEVSCLQTKVGATADGSFGPMTKASVMAYQSNHGLSADGVVGPMSRAVLNGAVSGNFPAGCTSASGFSATTGLSCVSLSANTFTPPGCTSASGFSPVTGGACVAVNANTFPAGCTSAAGFSPTTGASCAGTTPVVVTGPLTGGAGDMDSSEIFTDVEVELVEGKSDVKNLGFKIEAQDSDIQVTNMKVTLTKGGSGSTYLDRYVSDVSVWMSGTKVATIATADFSKDSTGVYSKSVALANAVIKEGVGNKATFYITTSGISNIDTADMGATWTIKVDNVRFQDGTGVIMIDDESVTSDALDVTDITTSGDVKLVVSKGAATPATSNVEVSDTSSTSDILMIEVKAKNTGADMTFDSLAFDITTDATTLTSMIGELILKEGSTELASVSTFDADASQTVAFDLDETYTIKAGETKYFRVYATINDVDNFAEGEYLKVSLNESLSVFEVASTRTEIIEDGSAVGEDQIFFSQGAVVKYVSETYAAYDPDLDYGTLAMKFSITAMGDNDVVIKEDSSDVLYTLSGVTDSTVTDLISSTDVIVSGGNFTVTAGDTKTFTLSTKFASDTAPAGPFKITLISVDGTAVANVSTGVHL